jgi:hypothetical protein
MASVGRQTLPRLESDGKFEAEGLGAVSELLGQSSVVVTTAS